MSFEISMQRYYFILNNHMIRVLKVRKSLICNLLLPEGNLPAEFGEHLRGDVEERGDVPFPNCVRLPVAFQREHLHHLWTAVEQPTVAATGGVAVVVKVAPIDHLEQVLCGAKRTKFERFSIFKSIFAIDGSVSKRRCNSAPLMMRTWQGMSASIWYPPRDTR